MNSKSGKTILILILLLGAIGLYFSYLLGVLHYTQGNTNWLANSLCGGRGSYFDCHKISHASFSSIWGLPLAFWGMGFYIFVLLVAIAASRHHQAQSFWYVILFYALLFGSLFDLFLLAYSLFVVKGICPLCSITYAANWTAFIILLISRRKIMERGLNIISVLQEMWQNKIPSLTRLRASSLLTTFILLTIFTIIGSNKIIKAQSSNQKRAQQEKIIQQILANFQKEPVRQIKLPDYAWYGNPNAPITLVEFSDFMCPFCARVSPVFKFMERKFPGKFRIKFINYPLDMQCNAGMSRQLHPGACDLAKAAHCAQEQGQFWAMHDLIFQSRLHAANYEIAENFANRIGLDISKFKTCFQSKKTDNAIQNQIAEADRLGVQGTPSIFINGKRYKAMPHPLLFEKIMKMLLKN